MALILQDSGKVVGAGKPDGQLAPVHNVNMVNGECLCYRLLQHPAEEKVDFMLSEFLHDEFLIGFNQHFASR